jgi:branched-chain amino acid transport system ATP-binding protein
MSTPLLEIDDIEVVYDQIILALRGVSLVVPRGAIVALLGANGAGKTTTLKAVSALLGAERGALTRGAIRLDGQPLAARSPRDLVRAGVVQVLEGRHCFPHLSVEENLVTGALVHRPSRAELRRGLDRIYAYFPRLALLRRKPAGLASGGEQQMVAIGRALLAEPRLVLLDEPSMGLAPLVVAEIFAIVAELHAKEGVSFLVAEQNARLALRHATHGVVLENGRVVAEGSAAELSARPDVKEFYLGVGRPAAAPGNATHVRRKIDHDVHP